MYPILIGLFIALLGVTGIGVYKHYSPNTYKDDNFIEEKAEEVLKSTTGVDVDLTPTSKE